METSQKGRNMRLRISLIAKICHPSLVLLGVVMIAGPAAATEFTFGEVNMSLGTTVSAAASIRTSKQSCDHISVYNGGCHAANGADYDANSDDGNVNIERGELISAPLKVLAELDTKWRNFGFFARAKAFWDPAAYDLGDGVEIMARLPRRSRSAAICATLIAATTPIIASCVRRSCSTLLPTAISMFSATCRSMCASAGRS